MGMTMTQKILARSSGHDNVTPGMLISAKVDMVLGNDITAPVAIKEFEKAGVDRVFDKEKLHWSLTTLLQIRILSQHSKLS